MKVKLRQKDSHEQGKICESVHKIVSIILHAQEKICKSVNRVSSVRKKDLQNCTGFL